MPLFEGFGFGVCIGDCISLGFRVSGVIWGII